MQIKLILYTASIALAVGLGACKPKKPDPIPNTANFKADFTIKERVGEIWVETDSVVISNSISFTANDNYDSYEWKIGDDNSTYTTKSCSTIFLTAEGDVTVRLIAKGKKNPYAPNDDGVDTVYKTFKVMEWGKSQTIGEYEGYVEGRPNDKFTVTVKHINIDFYSKYFIKNIQKGCVGYNTPSGIDPANYNQGIDNCYPGGKVLYFNWQNTVIGNCRQPKGMVKMLNKNTIIVDYTLHDTWYIGNVLQTVTTQERFIGIRK